MTWKTQSMFRYK